MLSIPRFYAHFLHIIAHGLLRHLEAFLVQNMRDFGCAIDLLTFVIDLFDVGLDFFFMLLLL